MTVKVIRAGTSTDVSALRIFVAVTSGSANVTAIVIPSAHRTISGAKPENKQRVFQLQARDLMGYVRKGQADHAEVLDALQAMAEEAGLGRPARAGQDTSDHV
jgi:hypothetical protein